MARPRKTIQDPMLLAAALEGLELQKTRIEQQIRQVKAMLGKRGSATVGLTPAAPVAAKPGRRKRRAISSEGLERIAAAQKKRWSKFRNKKKVAEKAD